MLSTNALHLAHDLAAALDPVVFAQWAGIVADDWQAQVLRSATGRMLLNCARQSGKSTTAAVLGLHTAIYAPGSLVLLLSPSLRQSQELFRKLAALYTLTGAIVPPKAESALRLELETGSRVISLPATEVTVRGYSAVDLLLIDEAARVSTELYASVRPMLAVSGGRLIAMSTPFGRRGWWSDAWHGPEDWDRYEVPATMCPRISSAFLEEERRTMGEWWYQQEYACTFSDATSAVFRSIDIEHAQTEAVELWDI